MRVEFDSVTKKYGDRTAVSKLSFSLETGEVVGFVGPNGAGKTTTMKLMLGLFFPDEGTIYYDGVTHTESVPAIRSRFGFLPENNPLPEDAIVADYLEFLARLKGLKNPKGRIKDLSRKLNFYEYLLSPIGNLSKGYRQRVGISAAMLSEPEVLVLDEPQEGLDPAQRVEIRHLIKELGKEKTVILSTHILSEVAETCRRIILINEGTIIADTLVSDFLKRFSGKQFVAVIRGKDVLNTFKAAFRDSEIELRKKSGDIYEISIWSSRDVREDIFRECVKREFVLLELYSEQSTLEEAFLKITGKNEGLSREVYES
jgi:ABC-2 type transport system ATP-binding protein